MNLLFIILLAVQLQPPTPDVGPHDARDILQTTSLDMGPKKHPTFTPQVPLCSLFLKWAGLERHTLDTAWLKLGEIFFGRLRNSSICSTPEDTLVEDDEVAWYLLLGWIKDSRCQLPPPAPELLQDAVSRQLLRLRKKGDDLTKARISLVLGCTSSDEYASIQHYRSAYGVDTYLDDAVCINEANHQFRRREYKAALTTYRACAHKYALEQNSVLVFEKQHWERKGSRGRSWRTTGTPAWRCYRMMFKMSGPSIPRAEIYRRNDLLSLLWSGSSGLAVRYAHYMNAWCLVKLGRRREIKEDGRCWFPYTIGPVLAIQFAPMSITETLDNELGVMKKETQ